MKSWNWITMKHISLRSRIILSFASLILIFLCVGGYNYITVFDIKEQLAKQTEEADKELFGYKLKQEVEDLSLYMSGYLISKDSGMKEEFGNKLAGLKAGAAQLSGHATTSEERKWKAQFDMTFQEYAGVFEQAEAIINDKSLTPAEVSSAMSRLYDLSSLHKEFVFETIDKFIEKYTNDSNQAQLESDSLLNSTATVSMLAPLLVLLAALVVAFLLIRSFTHPIKELQTAINRIAEGDLRTLIRSDSRDELGMLSQSFDLMISQVRDMLMKSRNIASSLSGHSREFQRFSHETAAANRSIVQAIEEISYGADQQAQQSEASSHIIGELEHEIRTIWDYAQTMRQMSSEAERTTVAGTESVQALSAAAAETEKRVNQALEAMNEVAASSAQIGKIVNTITDISTQTNILSLNAAIEAARAGGYGKGFSVIAEEVRILSQQTNDSSKSISAIIRGLTGHIEALKIQLVNSHRTLLAQNSQVDQTLTSFSAIQDSMKQVSGQIAGIHQKVQLVQSRNNELILSVQHVAAVAEETAAGVQEVNSTSLQQDSSIRQIAQQSQDIDQLSQSLFYQISRFRIDAEPSTNLHGKTDASGEGQLEEVVFENSPKLNKEKILIHV
jgi:methyl-accepting chemotaxis protein